MDLANATVAQLLVPIDDFDGGVTFFKDVLGLPHLFSAPPQMAFFQCGDVRLLVGVLPKGEPAQRGSAIYFRVADIHATHETLEARGVKFRAAPHVVNRTPKSELWLAEFTDPDGNALALMSEMPARAVAAA
jgi:Predicted enzyme related to lactoylglutathione lyase